MTPWIAVFLSDRRTKGPLEKVGMFESLCKSTEAWSKDLGSSYSEALSGGRKVKGL